MSAFNTIIRCQCPNCNKANAFVDSNPYHLTNLTKMQSRCPICDFNYEKETGFHFLSMYMSYALTSGFSIAFIILLSILFGLDNFLYYITINAIILIVFFPFIFRWARMMSIWFVVKYKW